MQQDTVIPFPHPQLTVEDPLTAVVRQGAQRLLAQAIEMEVAMLLTQYADHRDSAGGQAIVGNGSLPARDVQTGIGAVRVAGATGAGSQWGGDTLSFCPPPTL